MNCFYCIYRYMNLKSMSEDQRKNVVKRFTIFGGKAAPGYEIAKNIIKLINHVANIINNDKDTNKYFKMLFMADYKVSLAQIIIPAADLSHHISTAGTEASGTSNMKFAMTGSLIIGTKDGANIEIADEIGKENIYFFGKELKDVERIRKEQKEGRKKQIGSRLLKIIEEIIEGKFGDNNSLTDYLCKIINGDDYYLIAEDFYDYLNAQENADEDYKDSKTWRIKTFQTLCRMGFFSTDRSIKDYSENIWDLKAMEYEKPVKEKNKRVISSRNLKKVEKSEIEKFELEDKLKEEKIDVK